MTTTSTTGAVLEPHATIAGVVVARPTIHADERGRFVETYRAEWFPGQAPMVQGNHAERRAGSVVGLHYHRHQADYWYVVRGHARAVLHDLRTGSPTEGATATVELGEVAGGDHNHHGLFIPPGVAHGFAALSDLSLTYLVDATYDPADELGVAWDDPEVGADWGVADPVLSERDQALPRRAAIPAGHWPQFPVAP
ncbi:MAG: dTDP-4-dehydrorhamnose 3,5-epimerase-like enzyme [Ilumatobacteraceae bacterium]|nr:dTDP-4-dehydrorhamnose 3,5-epimerase-like enzyme [Ilumatobacteraceae bacterium]